MEVFRNTEWKAEGHPILGGSIWVGPQRKDFLFVPDVGNLASMTFKVTYIST